MQLTARNQVETVHFDREGSDGVQVSHHAVGLLPALVVEKPDVVVLVGSDGHW